MDAGPTSSSISLSDNYHRAIGDDCNMNGLNSKLEAEIYSNDGKDYSINISEVDSGYCSPLPEAEIVFEEDAEKLLAERIEMYSAGRGSELSDADLVDLTIRGTIPLHSLEKLLGGNYERAISIRRSVVANMQHKGEEAPTNKLPFENYDYSAVVGRCAENIIGYMPVPVGVAGPLVMNGTPVYLPMATTEGALIASTSRGCKAINAGAGLHTVVVGDQMTRAPILSFDGIVEAAAAKAYIESPTGQVLLCKAFNSTTSYGKLASVTAKMAGRALYLRFSASTGEAMGMNMIGKATEAALRALLEEGLFESMRVESLSGNLCTDKKPAAINWILGRGKSVVAEATIPAEAVRKILKCSVSGLVKLNNSKNLVGSALAGMASGGFNAHAANVVTAMFLATGQDPAQNVVSSNCLTQMEELVDGSLYATVTMPSLEVGTIGGGTSLEPQAAMLEIVGAKGVFDMSGKPNGASTLASAIAGGVLAGELSLCAALVTGELIQSHMKYNRKPDLVAVAC